jgi:hypothetical protein
MEDRDVFAICLCIIGLSALALLHGKLIGMMADKVLDVQADVNWLKDNTVAHETEARP